MLAQIESTEYGYIVGVYLTEGNGYGHWVRLRNFGDRQGDAICFRDYDLPKLSDTELRMLAKSFSIEKKYYRAGSRRYITQKS